MTKQFWGFLAAIVIILIGVFIFTGHKSTKTNGNQAVSGATHHVEGKGSTGVKLVEYGDYQCPYCEEYYPVVKQVESEFDSQITFQFANFPLVNVHQNAFAAARAAEAAAMQGKFWQMHDALYENNDPNGASGWVASTSPTSYFNQFATQIGLNLTKFKADYASEAVNNAINADLKAGNQLGIQGTPSFYLDGKQIQVAAQAADFEKVINAAIKSKTTGATDTTTTSGNTSQTTKQ